MATKRDYTDHAAVLIMVSDAQDSERTRRARCVEAKRFLKDRDGMWDQDSTNKMKGKFKGQFDRCTPIVDGIAGEIEQADFTIRVSPTGGRASTDTAKTIDGLIRNIRNISNAEAVFNDAARSCIEGGFDAWEIETDWVDGDAMDQDIFIRRIPNANGSVWFDMSSVERSPIDAGWATKLVGLPIFEYRERWPGGGGVSVGDNAKSTNRGDNPKEVVTVGKLYYRKEETIDLVMMTDGAVYRDDDKFKNVQDELAKPTEKDPQGITIALNDNGEEKRRKRKSWRIWSRMYDGGDWLADAEETVFDFIPIVPIYGNYDWLENERVYFGVIENLMDPQRVLNYAQSRDIEDGALSPAESIWMTEAQKEGNDYSRMNVDRDPVRIYSDDPAAKTPPFKMAASQVNAGLQTTIANMQETINSSSNTFSAQQGNATSTQSGIAGLQQIEQGNIGTIKWSKALEVALCYTAKVIMGALPRVYDGTRTVRITGEDGTTSMESINKPVFDEQTKTNIILNDLSIADYDAVCVMGPAFNSAQKEAARALEATLAANPALGPVIQDVLFKQRTEPGMDVVAERLRVQAFNNGVIPETQWTDEEREQVQAQQAAAANQPPQQDPLMIAAQAEAQKAQAELQQAANKQTEVEITGQIKMADIQLRSKIIDLDVEKFIREGEDKFSVEAARIDQTQQGIDQKSQQMIIDADLDQQKFDQQLVNDQFAKIKDILDGQQQQVNDAVKNIQLLGDIDQFDYDPEKQELIPRA